MNSSNSEAMFFSSKVASWALLIRPLPTVSARRMSATCFAPSRYGELPVARSCSRSTRPSRNGVLLQHQVEGTVDHLAVIEPSPNRAGDALRVVVDVDEHAAGILDVLDDEDLHRHPLARDLRPLVLERSGVRTLASLMTIGCPAALATSSAVRAFSMSAFRRSHARWKPESPVLAIDDLDLAAGVLRHTQLAELRGPGVDAQVSRVPLEDAGSAKEEGRRHPLLLIEDVVGETPGMRHVDLPLRSTHIDRLGRVGLGNERDDLPDGELDAVDGTAALLEPSGEEPLVRVVTRDVEVGLRHAPHLFRGDGNDRLTVQYAPDTIAVWNSPE